VGVTKYSQFWLSTVVPMFWKLFPLFETIEAKAGCWVFKMKYICIYSCCAVLIQNIRKKINKERKPF